MNPSSIEKAREGLEKDLAMCKGKILRYYLVAMLAFIGGVLFFVMERGGLLWGLAILAAMIVAFFIRERHISHPLRRYYLDGLKTLARDPETADDYAERADIFAGQDMLDEAIEDFEMALKLEPDDADTMYDYAYMLWRQKKDGAAALPWVEKLAKIVNDNQGEAYCMKGEILGQTDLWTGLEWIDMALEIDDDAEWTVAKVRLLLQHEAWDRIDEAIDEATKHLKTEDWRLAELFKLQGQLAMTRGGYKEAVEFFTRAFKCIDDDDYPELFLRRAEAYDALGVLDKADADRRKAEKLRG